MSHENLRPEKIHETKMLFKVASAEERQSLRSFKKRLLDPAGDLTRDEVNREVDRLYKEAKPFFDKIPPDSALVVMPSGSGKNIIPAKLADRIAQGNPEMTIYNQDNNLIRTASDLQSKTKGNYTQRIADQKSFDIFDSKQLNDLKKEKQVFIIDDVVSSGETATILKRQLEGKGINVSGVASAVGVNRSLTSERDLNRLHDKLKEQAPPEYSASLKKDIYDMFAGFPRRKLTMVEGDLNRGSQLASVLVEKDQEGDVLNRKVTIKPLVYEYINKSAEHLRQNEIDASSIESRKALSLENKFPNLSKENIEKYDKLFKQVQNRGRKPGGLGNEIN